MSRMYSVSYQGTLTTAGGDADLFEFIPADDKPIRLKGLLLGQTSEVGDAAEESLRIAIVHLPATFTTGNGTAVTPQPIDPVDTAAGFTAKANGATLATTSGTASTIAEFAWNIRISPIDQPFPDDRLAPMVRQAAGLVVRCHSTPGDDISIAITAFIEEI